MNGVVDFSLTKRKKKTHNAQGNKPKNCEVNGMLSIVHFRIVLLRQTSKNFGIGNDWLSVVRFRLCLFSCGEAPGKEKRKKEVDDR